jgi:ABC-type polysaccharide/polyol phosphate export permease
VLLVFVFSIGLRTNPGGNITFVVYLISGMIAGQFFSATFNSLTQVVKTHSFLVRKGDFSLSILHVAKILCSLIPHLLLLLVTIIVCWLYGYRDSLIYKVPFLGKAL